MADEQCYNDRLKALGLNVKYYRMKKGLTQKQLAEKLLMSEQQISRIESPNNEHSTKLDTLFAIADALEIDVALLFTFK